MFIYIKKRTEMYGTLIRISFSYLLVDQMLYYNFSQLCTTEKQEINTIY